MFMSSFPDGLYKQRHNKLRFNIFKMDRFVMKERSVTSANENHFYRFCDVVILLFLFQSVFVSVCDDDVMTEEQGEA